MINNADEKIGTREFFAIIWLTIGMKLTYTTPSLLYKVGNVAAWMIPFFYAITIGIPFLVLLSLLKKHEKGLTELLTQLTGKYIGSFLSFVLFSIVFLEIILINRNYISITNSYFYPETPVYILMILLLGSSLYIAKRGFSAISNGTWFITPALLVILYTLIFLSWKELNWVRIFPVFGPGIGKLVMNSVTNSSIVGEIILLTAFFPFVRSYKSFKIASFSGFGISLFSVAVFIIVYIMVFDYPSVLNMGYPHHELTRMVNIGIHINHIEGMFFIFWVIGSVFRFAILLYLAVVFLGASLCIKQFESLLIPVTGLILISSLLPENIFTMALFRDIIIKTSSGVLIILPFILWIIDKWKGR
ncbi:GerAB/ArcD/ProY family transporter [Sporosarcina siberiensis]|uniref:GerAB/ArcD/ProY family transporter n=1 Tax=Sporosarcina siberiensis TaxID=1365606 RepID=A0ABW4SJ05_9BACL